MPRLSKYTRFTLLLLASKWVGKYLGVKKARGKWEKFKLVIHFYSFLVNRKVTKQLVMYKSFSPNYFTFDTVKDWL